MYQLIKEIPITLTIAVATVIVFLAPGFESLLDFQTNSPVLQSIGSAVYLPHRSLVV